MVNVLSCPFFPWLLFNSCRTFYIHMYFIVRFLTGREMDIIIKFYLLPNLKFYILYLSYHLHVWAVYAVRTDFLRLVDTDKLNARPYNDRHLSWFTTALVLTHLCVITNRYQSSFELTCSFFTSHCGFYTCYTERYEPSDTLFNR